jgi:hypothetical protein
MRILYHCVVGLHPAVFRRQFGPEMELIFDESGRSPRLLTDVFISLLRQWVLRCQIWIYALAVIGGFIPFALAFGFLRLVASRLGFGPTRLHGHRVVAHTVSAPITEPFLMLTAVIAVMFISGTLTLAIAWFRHSQQRRRV